MADVKLVIKMPEELYKHIKNDNEYYLEDGEELYTIVENGTPFTPDVLADLLMEERIRGELKQNICYSRDIVDNVECNLTVEIIDRRPCYCGAELREMWRESEDKE